MREVFFSIATFAKRRVCSKEEKPRGPRKNKRSHQPLQESQKLRENPRRHGRANLIAIQTESFEWFKEKAWRRRSPTCVHREQHERHVRGVRPARVRRAKYTVDECKEKDVSYQAPLFVEIRFINRETGEIKEQDVFMATSRS